MSLFRDDFYSTKVSRRTRTMGKTGLTYSSKRNRGGWSTVRIAFLSSFTSAIAAMLLFGVFFGTGSGGIGSSGGVRTTAASLQAGDPLERTIQAAAKVRPAVVSVINEQAMALGMDEAAEGAEEGTLEEAGVGSGVIYKKSGGKALIITNYHVVANAAAVKAVLMNGEKREAKVVGKDQITDLAVLEIDAAGIDVVAEIGDSQKLRAGEFVMAIGNPLGLGDSLTMGIVSKTRQIVPVSLNQDGVYDWEQEVIQIDASINNGNSGGPLIDMNGRVVGINSMKVADLGVEGIGFAIPMANAQPIVNSLVEHGKVPRPYIGVYTLDLEQYWAQQGMLEGSEGAEAGSDVEGDGGEQDKDGDGKDDGAEGDEGSNRDASELKLPDEVFDGVIVLEASGPAKKAGLEFNDVIVKLDGKSIGSTLELRQYIYANKKIGDELEVTYFRGGKEQTVTLKLAEKEEEK
ncbi:S1C family serine protease [Paenibacillus sp. GCM10023252]|uniref:S1C family serine protease n=1 Tax=Paenibacillus sp. GCM10023252 TaxID=3252649 RepID=UPI00362225F4